VWTKFILAIGFLCAAATVDAGQSQRHFVKEWRLTVVETWSAPPSSDAMTGVFELRTVNDDLVARSRPIIGPLLISPANNELVSCEAQWTMGGVAVLVFDLSGSVVAEYPHPGYLRNCGTSIDGRIYWLNYSLIENDHPYSLVVLLGPRGHLLATKRLDHKGTFTWTEDGNEYSFDFPEPDWPG
jgi:hypothetical protein